MRCHSNRRAKEDLFLFTLIFQVHSIWTTRELFDLKHLFVSSYSSILFFKYPDTQITTKNIARKSMAVFSDSDSDVGQVAKSNKRARATKSKTNVLDDWDGDSDAIMDNDESDFEIEDEAPKKKKSAITKKTVTKTATLKKTGGPRKKASAADSSESLPLQPIDEPNTTGSPVTGQLSQSNTSASTQYQKLSQLEHILKRPDTYIGSIERTESLQWIYDAEEKSMVQRNVTTVPGLYKIFDEILVNAADNKTRDPSMNLLEVTIDPENNTISVYNNGKGIPIEIHDKEKIYIPELIFGNLLTSSNYDDDQKKVTGGRNGFGAKVWTMINAFL